MAIKSIVGAICTCLTVISFNVYAADDTTIANIDSKASSANNKADGNNSRIQALETEDIILHNRIDTISSTLGPKGDKGDPGPAGSQGVKGDTGPQGFTGADGVQGIQGEPGPIGLTGDTGPVGPQGIAGPEGPLGPIGATGVQGPIGPTGPQGEPGPQGPIGPEGLQGVAGADGINGSDGADSTIPGPQGVQGPAGLSAVIFNYAPTVNDDMNASYTLGSVWIDTSTAKPYILVDNSAGAAVWTDFGSTGGSTIYAIGDTGPAGGIVFHITDGGLHGLEAATVDQQASTQWGCSGTLNPVANGTAVGTGAANTANIIAGCNETPISASVASAYGPGWFLPSMEELRLLYAQKASGVVGGFASQYYWSSSQIDIGYAWLVNFNGVFNEGAQAIGNKLGRSGVRAVRAF